MHRLVHVKNVVINLDSVSRFINTPHTSGFLGRADHRWLYILSFYVTEA